MITTSSWESNAMSNFHLIYIPQYTPLFFDEYAFNINETKSPNKMSQVHFCGEQPTHNVDKGDVF